MVYQAAIACARRGSSCATVLQRRARKSSLVTSCTAKRYARCRELYKQGITRVGPQCTTLLSAWEAFEYEVGSLSDIDAAQARITARRSEIERATAQQQPSRAHQPKQKRAEQNADRDPRAPRKRQRSDNDHSAGSADAASNGAADAAVKPSKASPGARAKKRPRVVDGESVCLFSLHTLPTQVYADAESRKRTLFVRNLAFGTSDDEISAALGKVRRRPSRECFVVLTLASVWTCQGRAASQGQARQGTWLWLRGV